MYNQQQEGAHTKKEVRVRTVDSIIKELERHQIKTFSKLVLKIDVEGAEYEVVIGAKEVIEKYRPIVCEMWSHHERKT